MKPIEGARARQARKGADHDGVEDIRDESESAPRNADGLRTDGPTLEEYVAAGYSAAGYPPEDYAAIDSPGWEVEKARRAEVTRQAGEAFIADQNIPDEPKPEEPEGEP